MHSSQKALLGYQRRLTSLVKPILIDSRTIIRNFCTNSNSTIKDKKAPYEGVIFKDHSEFVSEIILNEPKRLNSLDIKMIRSILKKVRQWVPYNIDGFSSDSAENSDKPKPKVTIFSSSSKHFCAGGNIIDLYNAKLAKNNDKILKDFFRYEYLLDYSITRMEPIQVSLWKGAVMGGGVGISINSPFRIATETASFAMPEAKIGLFTDVGASYFLPKLVNNSLEIGLYLGFTGEKISGKELAVTGIATHFVKEEGLDKLKKAIIDQVDSKLNKDALNAIIAENTDMAYNPTHFSFPNLEAIKYVFKPDTIQSIFSRLKVLAEGSQSSKNQEIEHLLNESTKTWAEKTINVLNRQSPLSLSVILELLKRGQKFANIEEAFELEIQLVNGFMEDSDFFEGVRSLLVDKDNNPKWAHKSIYEIDEKQVLKKYFERCEEIDIEHNL